MSPDIKEVRRLHLCLVMNSSTDERICMRFAWLNKLVLEDMLGYI